MLRRGLTRATAAIYMVFTSPCGRRRVLLRRPRIKAPAIKQHSARTLAAAQELNEYKLVLPML